MKVSKRNLIYYITYLSCFPPKTITEIPYVGMFLNCLQVLLALYFLMVWIRGKKPSAISWLSIIYIGIVFFSTFINQNDLYACLIYALNLLGFVLFLDIYLNIDLKKVIHTLKNYLYLITVINYLYLLYGHFVLQQLVDDSLFITVSNSLTTPLIFAMVLTLIDNYCSGKLLNWNILFLCIIISHTEILVWSATGLMGWFILIIYIFFFFFKQKELKLNIATLSISSFALFYVVTILRWQEKFSFIIVNLLKRNTTFTGRTEIWDVYIEKISESWLLGYGIGYTAYEDKFAHSGYLDILVKGGILAFCVFLIMLFVVYLQSKNISGHVVYNLLIITIFSFEIMMLAEMPEFVYMVSLFMLCTKIPEIECLYNDANRDSSGSMEVASS